MQSSWYLDVWPAAWLAWQQTGDEDSFRTVVSDAAQMGFRLQNVSSRVLSGVRSQNIYMYVYQSFRCQLGLPFKSKCI
jgi:hypothetical protein